MLFLARWQVNSEFRDRILRRFAKTGGSPPAGVEIVGRWHRADGTGGVMIMQADSMQPVTEFAYEWNDLLFVEIAPVVEDEGLVEVISKLKF
jgi:hypothetical protein